MKNLKHYKYLFLIVVGFISCNKDFLDVTPKDQLSDASVWADQSNADLFLNDIYNNLPVLNRETQHLDQYTDNSYVGAEWMWGRTTIATGAVAPNNVPPGPWDMWKWDKEYERIRKCNVFIQNVSASTSLSDDYKSGRIAEVRFLRALFYSWLYTSYGGVPIITIPLNNITQGDSIYYARSTDDETLQFITSELDKIIPDLPLERSGANLGRPTKGAALTLKGWVELYAASPLRNPSNDINKWKKAAETNKQVIDLGVYKLFPDFGGIWLAENNNNSEVIYDEQSSKIKDHGSRREGLYGPVYVHGIQQSWGNYAPSQELVDEFAMDNGKTIDDPASGYNPQNPYVNREKRFYKTILYDGAPWQGDTIWTRVGVGSPNQIDLGSANDVTNTGYYACKTLDERIKGQDNLNLASSGVNYIFFRYAEVLLNYAEAQNEVAGPDASVYSAVNAVRNRSDLPSLSAGLSKDQMRKVIRRERRVEFAFEDKRWWDVLRWKIAGGTNGVLNTPMHGMLIEKVNGVWTYKKEKVVDKVFTEKMYLMPIPQEAIDKNPKLQGHQNPGY